MFTIYKWVVFQVEEVKLDFKYPTFQTKEHTHNETFHVYVHYALFPFPFVKKNLILFSMPKQNLIGQLSFSALRDISVILTFHIIFPQALHNVPMSCIQLRIDFPNMPAIKKQSNNLLSCLQTNFGWIEKSQYHKKKACIINRKYLVSNQIINNGCNQVFVFVFFTWQQCTGRITHAFHMAHLAHVASMLAAKPVLVV